MDEGGDRKQASKASIMDGFLGRLGTGIHLPAPLQRRSRIWLLLVSPL